MNEKVYLFGQEKASRKDGKIASENPPFFFSDMVENPGTFSDRYRRDVGFMNKVFGYARVSTKEQHLDRQIKALLDCGVEEWI